MGASFVAQTVWNHLGGYPSFSKIKDLDLVYYDDSDLSSDSEKTVQQKVQESLKKFPISIDVVNEARVHLWYEGVFGNKIANGRL